jgi:hypothetical protein
MTTSIWHTYSRDERTAVVKRDKKGFFVELLANGDIVEIREVYTKSERYAEDVAENWVDGII